MIVWHSLKTTEDCFNCFVTHLNHTTLFLVIHQGLRLQIRKRDTYDDHTVDFSKKSETCDTAESSMVVTRSNSGVTLGQVEHSFTFSFSDELSPPEGQEQKVPVCPSASRMSSFHFRAVHRRLSSKVTTPAVKQIDQVGECISKETRNAKRAFFQSHVWPIKRAYNSCSR